MREPVTEIGTAQFHEIYVRNEHSGWCRLLWEDGGRVIIISDYGDWSYYWGCIGKQTVAEFLTDLDVGYMGGKMLGSNLTEFSAKNTARSIKEDIIEYRRNGDYTKEFARDEWERANELECGSIDYREWYDYTEFEDPDFYSTEMVPSWKYFWERLWIPMVVPALKQFIARGSCDTRVTSES